MAIRRRTIDLLPEIFRTDTNRKFLSATLDQLTQEPITKKTQGYVGRRVGPGVNPADYYVTEPTATRTNYQLEPGVIFLKPDTSTAIDAITYPGMVDALELQNANVTKQDRLFESQYYSWDPFCDLDKFSNYSQYYWLPQGPDSVDISTTEVPLTDTWEVTRGTNDYTFSDVRGNDPIITVARGGSYQFTVNQPGSNFWIQAAPGINGRLPATPNISSRNVLGVVNNGEDQGTVTFNVPLKTAQDFYYTLNDIGTVDLISTINFDEINNMSVAQFLQQFPTGIDGVTNLNNKTVIFINRNSDAASGGWQITTPFDPLVRTVPNQVGSSISYDVNGQPYDSVPYETLTDIIVSGSPDPLDGQPGSYDSILFDQTTEITSQAQRYSVWQIQYITTTGLDPYIRLSSILSVSNLSKFKILFGETYSSTQWYKNASGYFEEMPLLTAVLDTLWYQDSTNPEIFGQIRLIDAEQVEPIDINDIVGAKNYISRNGVEFTNGLKVQFRGPTIPAGYQDLEYYVEGVGTGPGISERIGFIDGEAYFGPWHYYNGQKMSGAVHQTDIYQQYIYDSVDESLLNIGSGGPDGASLPTTGVPGAYRGNGIILIPVNELVTPETYTKSETIPYDFTSYDSTPWDASLNAPTVPDYITINRASQDRNAWSRSNRWFHKDVLNATAEYNNQVPSLDNNFRGKRPIIEFRSNIDLYNNGTQAKPPVNIVDFSSTDAFSNINGQRGYSTDGYTFIDGSLVIFANDSDATVRNRIYKVKFIDPTGSGVKIIDLIPVENSQTLINQTVVCLSGNTQQGKTYWFDGVTWYEAQEKTGVNQPPLFDVFDSNGVSFSNRAVYPSSTFTGSKLFGYGLGTTSTVDVVIGFALKYLNINNLGDIVFENYLYNDTFIYVKDNVSSELNISTGVIREYVDRVSFTEEIGWQKAAAENRSRQIFRFAYNGTNLKLDVPVVTTSVFPAVQMFVEGVFVDPGNYTVTISGQNTIVELATALALGTIIELQVLSNYASNVGFYEVPLNLENNPLNENSGSYTLGTIRTHYESIGQNLKTLVGPINGANNTRDLGNLIPYGDNIVQHSSPLALTGVFLREQQYELFNSLRFNSQEYTKYKSLLLDLAAKGNYINLTPTQVLDTVLQEISLGRSNLSPFYWSDMIPSGETYTETTYTYSFTSDSTFDLTQIYSFTDSNYQSVLVYLNGNILTRGYDYIVSADSPTMTITATLAIGDVVKIREYNTTYGSYVPNTPTKIGLFPSFKPEMYVSDTYVNPTEVIQGHDGSITVAFGDFRDQVLLEFETRIFNNLKIVSEIPLTLDDVMPGQFRTTEYSLTEVNSILSEDFLTWVGWNKLDYGTQLYVQTNPFTYNYSQSGNKLDQQPLLGNWRGNYLYFYDTITPNTTPWEMLGFSQQPYWWEAEYGPAPYTSGNLVLWEDLENGLVKDPIGHYVDPRYVRPGLTQVIPSGTEGELTSPFNSIVGNYDSTSFKRSWIFGDDGPVESAWRTSSAWPFAVMKLLALTKPAKFFALFADRDRYVYNTAREQYLWDDRYRLDAKNLKPLYGNGTSKASYINWIIDYNRQRGVNSTTGLTDALSNIDVRLCWRMAAFSDKNYLKVYTERSTPNSLNTSLMLPDESYQLLLYKNQPFSKIVYSSIIVQSTDDGWAVYGYSTNTPYFNILVSKPSGKTATISAAGVNISIPVEYTNTVAEVPYGYTFTNKAAVCDFILSYGKLLETQGLIFENRENGTALNWQQMAQEFVYWSNQGWAPGAIINLNPAATSISVTRPGTVVESLVPVSIDNIILNQNRAPVPGTDLQIDRFGNTFKVSSLTSNTINFLNLKFTAYEHLVVLDNTSIFADLIYQPVTGARQSRVRVFGTLSGDWNGTVDAPGFVLNQDNIVAWIPNKKYAKGEIVLFKNEYWSAGTIIQPSQEFNYAAWIKSDYGSIQKGLLPNAATDSNQLAQAYSVYSANLEKDVDLFSYGLIGFRPREYMQALNLTDVSQVNLYQSFLGTKGTLRAAEIFTFANLGKEIAQYDIYEYWAMQRSTYGANANRSYFELLLNQALLPSDPALIQVIQPTQESAADQKVLLENVWKESYKLTSPDILPTTNDNFAVTQLPVAGYVSFDDADITCFSLEDPQTIADSLSIIGVGTTIWVAKTNSYDWNIYRVSKVPGTITEVSNNLNDRAAVTFSKEHNLSVGDFVIIKGFDTAVDGVYNVLAVPTLTTILISYTFVGGQENLTGTGIPFTLVSARFKQASDLADNPISSQLVPGAIAWIDDNGFNDQWEVIEKTSPFTLKTILTPMTRIENSRFGASVSQGFENIAALVGAPGYNSTNSANAPGAIYSYVKADNDQYVENTIIQLDATDVVGYGNAIDIGGQNWAAVGASESNNKQGYVGVIYQATSSNVLEQRQLLVSPDQDFGQGEFGYSVTVSANDQWMYIGAPGNNKVYAFAQVPLQQQSVKQITDGVTYVYNYSNNIIINSDEQITVVLGDEILVYGDDYTVTLENVVLSTTPTAGLALIITRKDTINLDQQVYYNVTQDATSGSGSGAEFTVYRNRGTYYVTLVAPGTAYSVGNTITINAATIGGGTSPANDLTITVDSVVSGGITAFSQSGSGVSNTSVFPLDPYLYTATDIFSFSVTVNGKLYRPFIDYDFNSDSALSSLDVVFNTVPPADATITVTSKTYYTFVDVLTVPGLSNTARFGHSVITPANGNSVIVGTPYADDQGKAYVFDRAIERFIVADSSVTAYTTTETLVGPTTVTLNGAFLVDTQGNINGNFTVSGNTVTITAPLNVGDTIEINVNQFNLIQTLADNNVTPNANFGYAIEQCLSGCNLFVGAPFDNDESPQGGIVEYYINQSRVYGTTTTTVANPTLTIGDCIRINNSVVECSGTSIEDLVNDINTAKIPNVIASLLPDVELFGDSTTKTFDVGTVYSAAVSYTPVVYVKSVLQTLNVNYTYNNSSQQITFMIAPGLYDTIRVVAGRMTVGVKNFEASTPANRLAVLPCVGTVFDVIGVNTYIWLQDIVPPVIQDYANFGRAISVNTNTTILMVGAPNGSIVAPTTFDRGTTYFDDYSSNFFDPVLQSGVVYEYDFLPSANPTAQNPGKWVFGQQLYEDSIQSLDALGTAVDYTSGHAFIGAPGADLGDSQANFGKVLQLENPTRQQAWAIKHIQQPMVNIALLNTVFMYDRVTGAAKNYFDYFNPLQGRMLGVIEQNVDYTGAVDPAAYNVGTVNNYGSSWAQERVGKIWWNTTNVRFIDPNQDDIVYASRRWGQIFPGSSVDVYQWIATDVAPADYAGTGTVYATDRYVVTSALNEQGVFVTTYYYWVKGITTIDKAARKTLSAEAITRYIENPRASGIPYIAPINASTIAIYNGLDFISAQDTILHTEFDREQTENEVHLEYQLIPQNRPDGFLIDSLYRKLQDSFCGEDTTGNPVPDPFLSPSEQYGVQFRPRQSMFINRFLALQNYLQRTNIVLAQYPIAENRNLSLLNSEEPQPSIASGAWNKRVANIEELSYQNLAEVSFGYNYLVESDSTNNGLWTIYETVPGIIPGEKILSLTRVQSYDTKKYWSYINWYRPGYNPLTRILLEVQTYSVLTTISVPEGSSVKVTANAQGKWEIYILESGSWNRVALQDGTIEFSATLWDYSVGRFGFDVEVFDAQYYDQEPVVETRKIIQSINQELFVGDLLIERNRQLILMFNYILSEQEAPVWLTKTSLIDVDHTVRTLEPYQIYRADNQDFVLNYIQEVKPYHTQIREFNLRYQGNDIFQGSLVDFDVPAYYNTTFGKFISPILDYNGLIINPNTQSLTQPTDIIWSEWPFNQWIGNYLLNIEDVTIVAGGSGYTIAPDVVVTGDCTTPAVMTALINSAGKVVGIDIVNSGVGYQTTAIITLSGGNGTGAIAVAVMGNSMVRDLNTTIKYDRYQYTSNIVDWEPDVNYSNGTMVRYDNRVWLADSSDSTGVQSQTFDPSQWLLKPAGELSGVDRTMGYYVPTANEPGLDLGLLISGVTYPGVQVAAPSFASNTGYDVGNYDINPFDNISVGPDGQPSYDPSILDAIYESEFVDSYLGIRPTDVNVVGGEFVDTYSSHAPEELVPGAIFDTLDIRVITTPGSDWDLNGHGFPIVDVAYTYDGIDNNFSFAGQVDYPDQVRVWNATTGQQLTLGDHYIVNWVARTITITSNVTTGNNVSISVYGIGGGNQLYKYAFNGAVVNNGIIIPIGYDLIATFAIFVNGVLDTDFTFTATNDINGLPSTLLVLENTYQVSDLVVVTAMGYTAGTTDYTYQWSTPLTEYFVADGATLAFTLSNNLSGTNPANIIIEKNGIRVRPSEGAEYIADGSSLQYYLPTRGGYNQSLVADNDVTVYIDTVPQILGVGYVVDPYVAGNDRTITLSSLPTIGSVVLISVRTASPYYISGDQLIFKPSGGVVPVFGDVISATTFNDTAQQELLTQVFVGPETQGVVLAEGYDDTVYDVGLIDNDPGSYDYSEGILIQTNKFDTGRPIANGARVVVTLNGRYLFENNDYYVDGQYIIIAGAPINAAAVVSISSYTDSIIPGGIEFRVFQDMRGLQTTYRVTENTKSILVQSVQDNDDIIYVDDVNRLSDPDLPNGIFGIVVIDGERIAYRYKDTGLNAISGLRRGTAGTAVANHPAGNYVIDSGFGNALPAEYQDRIVYQTYLSLGTQTTFVAEDISLIGNVYVLEDCVQVYIAGILQHGGYTVTSVAPVTVVFDAAPVQNYQVSIQVRQGLSWYEPGTTTASNGQALQITNTLAARFIRSE
jgi:hypothetical protein